MTILLVDDEPTMLRLWSRWLEPLRAEIRTATGVEDAIAQMAKIPPPDLVLIDLILSVGGARETAQSIDKLRAYNDKLTVLAVSGLDRAGILEAIEGVRIEGWACKGDAACQSGLLKSIQSAMQRNPTVMGNSELLTRIGGMIQGIRTQKLTA